MRNSRGYSLIELMISMGIGAVVLAGLVSLVFILYRDKNVIDQSNSLEETRRLISLQIHARMREALNTEVWLNTETLQAIGLPINQMAPPSILTGLYPPSVVLKDKAFGTSDIVDAPGYDIVFFVSRDPLASPSSLTDDMSGTPAFPASPSLFRVNGVSPYIYVDPPLDAAQYTTGSFVFIGTPAGATVSRLAGLSGPRVNLDQTPFGYFTPPPDTSSRSAIRLVTKGMFIGKIKVAAIGVDAATRDFVVADVTPGASTWTYRDRYPLAVEKMFIDQESVAPGASTIQMFKPLARQHTISIYIKRVLLNAVQQTGNSNPMEFQTTDSILSISL